MLRKIVSHLSLAVGILLLIVAAMSGYYTYRIVDSLKGQSATQATTQQVSFEPIDLNSSGATEVDLQAGMYGIWAKADATNGPAGPWAIAGPEAIETDSTIECEIDGCQLECVFYVATPGSYEFSRVGQLDSEDGTTPASHFIGGHPYAAIGEITGVAATATLYGGLIMIAALICVVSLVAGLLLLVVYALAAGKHRATVVS